MFIQDDGNVGIGTNSPNSLLEISNENNKIVISYEKSKIGMNDIIENFSNQNVKILDISTDDADIEDVYKGLIKS